jgi:hypothetical protein
MEQLTKYLASRRGRGILARFGGSSSGEPKESTEMQEMTADDPDNPHKPTRIGGRYMAAELAEACGRRHTVASELLVGVTPEKIVTRTNIAD